MQLTAADAGCWVDGHWGWRGSYRLIQLAHEFGWQEYTAAPIDPDHALSGDGEEFIHDIADEAEAWMNNNVAPDGHSFGWFDGEWFLWSHSTWEETE